MTHHDYKKVNTVCPKCKSHEVWRDNHREETYCNHCGLIIQDNSLFKITEVLTYEQNRNLWLNRFWRKTNSSFMRYNQGNGE